MSTHYDYHVGLLEKQAEDLALVSTALHGLVAIRANALDFTKRPKWWTDYHEGSIDAAMQLACDRLAFIEEDIRQQIYEQTNGVKR